MTTNALIPHDFKPTTEINASPRVIIRPQVLIDIQTIISLTDLEVGFFGLVKEHEKNLFEVYEILLPKQDISAATCELTPEGVGELVEHLLTTRPDAYNDMRAWFHSHHTMGVGPSDQDDTQFNELAENCDDYFLRGICNKKGRLKIDLNLIALGFSVIDVPWTMMTVGEDKKEKWEKEFKEKVSQISYKTSKWSQDPLWPVANYPHHNYNRDRNGYNMRKKNQHAMDLMNEGWEPDPSSINCTMLRKKNGIGAGYTYKGCARYTYEAVTELLCEYSYVDTADNDNQLSPEEEAQSYYEDGYRVSDTGAIEATAVCDNGGGTVTITLNPDVFMALQQIENDQRFVEGKTEDD